MKKYLTVKNMARIAIVSALGAVLMILDFPIFVAPSFYKLDIGDLPCIIGAFAMGPVPALFIQIIKILLKLLFKPTSSAFVGEIAAFICSSAYCISASLFYQLHKTKKGAIRSLVLAALIMAIVSCVANYFFIIPAYTKLYHMPLEAIIAAGSEIFPIVKDKLSFVLCCVLPFNLIKAIVVGAFSIVLYKHISPLLKD